MDNLSLAFTLMVLITFAMMDLAYFVPSFSSKMRFALLVRFYFYLYSKLILALLLLNILLSRFEISSSKNLCDSCIDYL